MGRSMCRRPRFMPSSTAKQDRSSVSSTETIAKRQERHVHLHFEHPSRPRILTCEKR